VIWWFVYVYLTITVFTAIATYDFDYEFSNGVVDEMVLSLACGLVWPYIAVEVIHEEVVYP